MHQAQLHCLLPSCMQKAASEHHISSMQLDAICAACFVGAKRAGHLWRCPHLQLHFSVGGLHTLSKACAHNCSCTPWGSVSSRKGRSGISAGSQSYCKPTQHQWTYRECLVSDSSGPPLTDRQMRERVQRLASGSANTASKA